jgi:hypothetical protein
MHIRMAQSILAVLLMGVHSSYATTATASAPAVKGMQSLSASCQSIKLKSLNKNIMLDGSDATTGQIYLIKNHSKTSIWLDHPAKRSATSAGWSSYLRPDDWSALYIDKKGFTLNCSVIQPGKVENLDCEQALTICKPQHLVYSPSRKGSFWLVEGKSWKELLKGLEKKGVK